MAIEDLTTYTEVDPSSDLTVTSSKCSVSTMGSNYDVYLRADKGAGHFGDFEHLVTAEFTTDSVDWSLNSHWALTAGASVVSLVDMDTANEGLIAYNIDVGGGNIQNVIKDFTNDNYDIWTGASFATPYYMTVERNGTTMTCKIYSDSGRKTLLDTLTIACGTDTYRYIFATMGHGETTPGRSYTGYVEGLDLQEVVASDGPVANPFIPRLLHQKGTAISVREDAGVASGVIKDDPGAKIVH